MQMRNLLIACVAIAALGQACAQVAPPVNPCPGRWSYLEEGVCKCLCTREPQGAALTCPTCIRSCPVPCSDVETCYFGGCLCKSTGFPALPGQPCADFTTPNPCAAGEIFAIGKGCICVNTGLLPRINARERCPPPPTCARTCSRVQTCSYRKCICLSTGLQIPAGAPRCPPFTTPNLCGPYSIYANGKGCICLKTGLYKNILEECGPP